MPHDCNGDKWACEACVRGHRASKCGHFERLMVRVKKPGRPLTTCPHAHGYTCGCNFDRVVMVRVQDNGSGCTCRITHYVPRGSNEKIPIEQHPANRAFPPPLQIGPFLDPTRGAPMPPIFPGQTPSMPSPTTPMAGDHLPYGYPPQMAPVAQLQPNSPTVDIHSQVPPTGHIMVPPNMQHLYPGVQPHGQSLWHPQMSNGIHPDTIPNGQQFYVHPNFTSDLNQPHQRMHNIDMQTVPAEHNGVNIPYVLDPTIEHHAQQNDRHFSEHCQPQPAPDPAPIKSKETPDGTPPKSLPEQILVYRIPQYAGSQIATPPGLKDPSRGEYQSLEQDLSRAASSCGPEQSSGACSDGECSCGPGCTCFGCLEHPFNSGTAARMQELGQILEEDLNAEASQGFPVDPDFQGPRNAPTPPLSPPPQQPPQEPGEVFSLARGGGSTFIYYTPQDAIERPPSVSDFMRYSYEDDALFNFDAYDQQN